MKKIRVAVLCGGKSAEHEVSINSARNIIAALDPKKYDVTLIGIDKQGRWHLGNSVKLLGSHEVHHISGTEGLALMPGKSSELFLDAAQKQWLQPIDVVFPVLHGPHGEDGTVQGLLKLANIPFVGTGVLGSAVCMDKDVMKRLLREAGLPIPKFLVYNRRDVAKINFENVSAQLGLPCFIKPANLGSSVGISKVRNQQEFAAAVDAAFLYDNKIIIEEHIAGREIECSVLGNDAPIASLPGEIIPNHEFYSYEAKYTDDGATLKAPATLSPAVTKNIQALAIQAFQTLCCDGMARVDFFLRNNEEIIINELNTIPGFTTTSMYPRMWQSSGIHYPDVIDKLIELALEKFESEAVLKTDYVE